MTIDRLIQRPPVLPTSATSHSQISLNTRTFSGSEEDSLSELSASDLTDDSDAGAHPPVMHERKASIDDASGWMSVTFIEDLDVRLVDQCPLALTGQVTAVEDAQSCGLCHVVPLGLPMSKKAGHMSTFQVYLTQEQLHMLSTLWQQQVAPLFPTTDEVNSLGNVIQAPHTFSAAGS